MPSPLEIEADEIERLSDKELVRLLNRLLWAEGRRLGIAPEKINTSLRINDPDGGLDALTEGGELRGPYFDAALIGWQYKKKWPGATKLKKELRGDAVQDAFRRGASYTLVLGKDVAPRAQLKYQKTLDELARQAGCSGKAKVLAAAQVAHWASTNPGALLEIRPQILGFLRASDVLKSAVHSTAFEPDEVRTGTIQAISRDLFGVEPVTSFVRIQGKPGVGKTRLALETVRSLKIEELTLYSPGVPTPELFAWAAANDGAQAVVIVDECDDAEVRALEMRAATCGGRVKLITVGSGLTTGPYVYKLDVMDTDVMERLVGVASPTLEREEVRWVAEKTKGYVKLALAVSKALQSGLKKVSEMPNDRDIREVVRSILIPSEEGQRALGAMALLTRVGFYDEAAVEGKAVAAFMGLQWDRLHFDLAPAIKEGIVVPKGRFLYVSPELLALWLAADVWGTQARRLKEFYELLPTQGSKDSFLERLSQLGDVDGVREVLEELLGDQGAFKSVENLDDARASQLFGTLARGAPEAGLRALERILGPLPDERLKQFRSGRREVLFALEVLLERRTTFFGAARMIRRLAETENEKLGNNATGVWKGIFLTFQGGTEVPALERLSLIEEILKAGDVAKCLLGMKALESVFEGHEVGRPLSTHGSVPARRYSPKTWEEVWATKRRALELLAPLLESPVAEIRERAKETFISKASYLASQGLAEDVIGWFEKMKYQGEGERRELWQSIVGILRYAKQQLTEGERARLEALARGIYGDSLQDRMRRILGRWMSSEWPEEEGGASKHGERAMQLATEAFPTMEEVRPLLPWLVSGDAENVWPFGFQIGKLDIDHTWFVPIFEASNGAKDPRLLSAYMLGRVEVGDRGWFDATIKDWADRQETAALTLDVLWRGEANDDRAALILGLIDKGWLSGSVLRILHMGAWSKNLSAKLLERILERLVRDSTRESIEAALAIAMDWTKVPEHAESQALDDWIWRLLENPLVHGGADMLRYYWKELAKLVLHRDPKRVSKAMIAICTSDDGSYYDERLEIFQLALKANPGGVWAVIGETLLEHEDGYRLARALETRGIMRDVPDQILIGWVKQHGAKAVKAAARSINLNSDELSTVARYLISNHLKIVEPLLLPTYMSGSWSGSQIKYWEGKLARVKKWAQDPDPAIRMLASTLASAIEARIREAKVWEEERQLP